MMFTTLMKSNKRARGFSLIEIMITMAIVGGIIVGIMLMIRTNRAAIRESDTRQQISALEADVEKYRTEHRDLPLSLEEALPMGLNEKDKAAKLTDPWGHPFLYRQTSEHGKEYDIWSMGPNNAPDTIIGNW
jgi:general secretion pathway protein G